jgi:hypothetical protein
MTEKSSPRGRPIKNKVDQSPASPEHGFADRTTSLPGLPFSPGIGAPALFAGDSLAVRTT